MTQHKLKDIVASLYLSQHFILFLSVLLFAAMLLFFPRLASARNLVNLASNMWPLFVLVIGQMFVLILGGIDLSQTSVLAMTSVVGGMVMTSSLDPAVFQNNPFWGTLLNENGGLAGNSWYAMPVGVLMMLLTGALIGLFNGFSVAKLKMPPFMVTLVSMIFFSGLAIYMTQSENITHLPASFILLGKGGTGILSIALGIVLIIAALSHFLLKQTVLGKWFYAIGKNKRAALVSGVPIDKVILLGYMFSGMCAAIAAILYSARLEGGRPTLGQNQLLDVIGAAVIGGISLFGGKGKILWAFYGALFFTLLANVLNMANLSFFTINIVKGCVILMAALLDVSRNRWKRAN